MTDTPISRLVAPNQVQFSQPTGLFINNEFVKSSKSRKITSYDPATEEPIVSVHIADAEDVDNAVKAAHAALHDSSWKLLDVSDRGRLLWRLADLIDEQRVVFATIEAWDNGKSFKEAMTNDLHEAVSILRYYAGWADKTYGQTISTTPLKFAYTVRQPMGVVAQIVPWNYPLAMATWKLGPALACGNTVVLKASEQTPLSILYLGQLVQKAGFPPGVVNLINGYGHEAGAALVEHPLVQKVAFTGSAQTAKQVMASTAKSLKNITLETGGKSPLLVFEDCDLEQAVSWSHLGIMSNQGQICTATSRILVKDIIFDKFVVRFVEAVGKISIVGDQWQSNTYQGPQVSKEQYTRILDHIKLAQDEGATLVAGGNPAQKDGKGWFVEPTVFTDVTPQMSIWKDEIFGPVVVIVPFKDEAEALELANDTQYGLGAAVFTMDLVRAHRVAAGIEAGMVWINSTQDCDPRIPFGGIKMSGIGRELGEAGLEAYSQVKAVHVNMGLKM